MPQLHRTDRQEAGQPKAGNSKLHQGSASPFQDGFHHILRLQRTMGNQAVMRLVQARQRAGMIQRDGNERAGQPGGSEALSGASGVPSHDGPALRQEAQERGDSAARGEVRACIVARQGDGRPEQTDPGAWEGSRGASASTVRSGSRLASRAPLTGAGRFVQASADYGQIQRQPKREKSYARYQIHVKQLMSQEEFKVAAMRQVFGVVVPNVEWQLIYETFDPENSPYPLIVDTILLRKHRGLARLGRGISVSEEGRVIGAEDRARIFYAAAESGAKSALVNEIDRRYFEEVGDRSGTKIRRGEAGKAELWRMIRDEVLFQHEYIANLPPQVKRLIKISIKGRDLTPADYEKLFSIAKKIENIPAGQVSDYASRVTNSTSDLDVFEASLDRYIAEMAERKEEAEERGKIHTKLIGLEEVYEKYRLYRTLVMTSGIGTLLVANDLRQELETQLQRHGFAGLSEFEAFIRTFEQAFEKEAVNIATDLLEKFAGRLYQESERYKNPAEVAALRQQLGGIPTRIASMSGEHPIFQEMGLPSNKCVDKEAFARASESELGELLQRHIRNRMTDISEARAEIEGSTSLVYKMDKLLPHFYVQQGIRPNSVHDRIIQDKMKDDAILNLVKGIGLAIVAVALSVVSYGSAAPVIVAAGAGIAGVGLGVYMALEEYQAYTQEKNLAQVGLSDDPSMVWLILAVVGACLDMATAVRAVKALGPAARTFNTSAGTLDDFTRAVRALEQANEVEARVARAVEQAAAARKGFTEASGELTRVMVMPGKVYSFPGPLADPEVYKAVVKLARQAIKAQIYDAQKFIDELRLARAKARLGQLTPEELAKAKQAWEEAREMVKIEAATVARYGDPLSSLLTRMDLTDALRNDIVAQVVRATTQSSVDDSIVRAAISSMRSAENPHNVREFLAELRHINEVAFADDLVEGTKVYGGVTKNLPDGSLRQFDLGDGIKVDISPVSEADALYRAGGKIHLDEVKHTASALMNKLREKPEQLKNLIKWRDAGADRVVMIVVESEAKWTNLLGTPDVFQILIADELPLKIGGKVFSPADLAAFHMKLQATYAELVTNGTMSARAFFELPEMATINSAANFVGYP